MKYTSARKKFRVPAGVRVVGRLASRWRGSFLNLTSSSRVTGSAPVVVSLTSHGQRLRTVHHAIESIAMGSVKPTRLILVVDSAADRARVDQLSAIQRLRRRGLEILTSSPVGPHAKYYPYVASEDSHPVPLVTADDDILYPPRWLESLLAAYQGQSDVIHCFRAHRFVISEGKPALYASWPPVSDCRPSYASFLTGVSGVIYPPSFLDELRERGEGFLQSAPKADDVWLNAVAVQAGYRVAQVGSMSEHFPVLIGTQATALWRHNTDAAPDGPTANDHQILASYTPEALDRVSRDLTRDPDVGPSA